MKIQRLVIENFKSIERIELIEPNPFTVFVGPNGSGKSNIFEALEFVNRCSRTSINESYRTFGGTTKIQPRNEKSQDTFFFQADFNEFPYSTKVRFSFGTPVKDAFTERVPDSENYLGVFTLRSPDSSEQFYSGFNRLFIKNTDLVKSGYSDDLSLNLAASNLEAVLKRVLTNEILKEEIFGWLELFVPGFKAVEVDDRDELHWFEKSSSGYFTKDLISDGTYNILALLTAVYQSAKPQFLCIEEPENGLHPQVAAEFVNVCRYVCEEFGHYIWLNTHSESIVRRLTKEEIVLIDKRDGATRVKQVGHRNFYDLQMDEAWLTGALGGGLPW